MDRGGIVGEDGPTHHGLFDFSFLRSLPNMVVMAPKDENELRRMVKTAVEYEKGPIAFRYPRGIGEGVQLEKDLDVIPIGEAQKLADGEDVLLLAIGRPVNDALAARSMLAEEGIYATVVNCRYVKPLDMDLIGALAQHIPNIITIEENVLQGGFGSAVLEALTDEGFSNLIVKRIGIPDTFVEHGTQKTLRDKYGITANGIVRVAKEMLTECQHPALALTSSLSKKAL
jgi:1-deoxy-D-xylulose-5-phosphate synthase